MYPPISRTRRPIMPKRGASALLERNCEHRLFGRRVTPGVRDTQQRGARPRKQ